MVMTAACLGANPERGRPSDRAYRECQRPGSSGV